MATTQSVSMTLSYKNTNYKRTYNYQDVSQEALYTAADKAKEINASLAGGTDGGLANFFRSEDYDDADVTAIVGNLKSISALKSTTTESTVLYGG